MPSRDLRKTLRERPCFGTFLKLPRPEVVDVLALAGFDFVICDMEHAQIAEPEARDVIRAGVAADLPVVVRLPDPLPGCVNRLLEAGAAGIQMPRVRARTDGQSLFAMTHFPPAGTRSVGTAHPLARYGLAPVAEYVARSERRTLAIGQFETRLLADPLDLVLQPLDVAFVGLVDLSVDFGVPGQVDHPSVVSYAEELETAAVRAQTALGAFVSTAEEAGRLVAKGYRYLAVAADITLLSHGARQSVNALREACGFGSRTSASQGASTAVVHRGGIG
jgi:2-keto-3-deoxy-L-rhamnonate aldolase RhmA